MTTATAIFGAVFTTVALFGGARALNGRGVGTARWAHRFTIATIAAHPAVVDFARATVRLAAVATAAEQLNIGRFISSTTRKGHNVVEF